VRHNINNNNNRESTASIELEWQRQKAMEQGRQIDLR
jgi:hypothetical protein